ncbi:hypothetical protein [Leifsonia sp. C5G2]|uniref:hypothetical protein n=1 Tax=Leifsonia sp. C5G2 TaxID=2735269 RepID=UPI001585C482|nr:hypothetical protein [Leifsonia sp. C5G2]NUU05662.1 hypothetical protein [Leifsonia sp. C5G2]
MTERGERDLVEGRYTQAQPETAEPRRVHGRYTGADDDPVEQETLGAYVGAQHDGEPPLVRSTRQRIGDYPRADHDAH